MPNISPEDVFTIVNANFHSHLIHCNHADANAQNRVRVLVDKLRQFRARQLKNPQQGHVSPQQELRKTLEYAADALTADEKRAAVPDTLRPHPDVIACRERIAGRAQGRAALMRLYQRPENEPFLCGQADALQFESMEQAQQIAAMLLDMI